MQGARRDHYTTLRTGLCLEPTKFPVLVDYKYGVTYIIVGHTIYIQVFLDLKLVCFCRSILCNDLPVLYLIKVQTCFRNVYLIKLLV